MVISLLLFAFSVGLIVATGLTGRLLVLALHMGAVLGFFVQQRLRFKCPRCRKPFRGDLTNATWGLPPACRHCGLPRFAANDAN